MSLYNNRNFYNSNCNCENNCDYNQVCAPDKIDNSCSLNSIRKAIIEIINAVKNEQLFGFNVDVEIVTSDGTSNIINFSKLTINNIQLTKTTLVTPSLAISLCDIAKITILTSTTTGSSFNIDLLNGIKNIATTCGVPDKNYYNDCSSCKNADVQCAQGIQNYINQNINTVETVSFNGNTAQSQTIQVVTDISTEDVLQNSVLDTTQIEAVTNSTLETTTATVTSEVTPTNIDVVSTIETTPTTVLSDVTETTVDVSAPITATPINVVTNVETTDIDVVTNVESTTKNVINQVSSTTDTVVTGFSGGSEVTGVISNVTNIQNITPTEIGIPSFTSTGTGVLQVTIAQQSIDGTNPVSDIVLNVKVGNQDITYNGNTNKYVLDANTNVLGGDTGSPTVVNVSQIGTPTTDTFTKTVSSTNIPVIDTITPTTTPVKVVNNVTTEEINNIDTPTTSTVIETLDKTTVDVENITNTTIVKPTDLLTTTTADVLSTANITNEVNNVLETATLNNTSIPVINDITTLTEDIVLPVTENIDGRIFAAGDGIMGVNNTNGDITIYSICDINTVKTLTT